MKPVTIRIFLFLAFAVLAADKLAAQQKIQFMQITTVESVVGGGLGRSKMLITNADGSQDERDLDNLFSLAGINFKNIRSNESAILTALQSYIAKGWKLVSTVPLTLSPGQSGQGIFMTRYLLSKEEQ